MTLNRVQPLGRNAKSVSERTLPATRRVAKKKAKLHPEVVPCEQCRRAIPFVPALAGITVRCPSCAKPTRMLDPTSLPESVGWVLFWMSLNVAGNAVWGVLALGGLSKSLPAVMPMFLIGSCLILGIARGNVWAWLFTRWASLFFAVLETIVLGMTLLSLLGTAGQNAAIVLLLLLLGAVSDGIKYSIFFALGSTDARVYFGLVCPRCASRFTRPANLLMNKMHCRKCHHRW